MTTHSLSQKSGIYKITNTVNQKIYVGSAVNLQARFNNHKSHLRKNTHHSIKLQRAWNKYGEDAFIFSVIEFVHETENLIKREQFYFDVLIPFGKNGYNIATVAGSILGVKRSDETKEKLRIASGSRTHTEETKIKISESKKGNSKHYPMTDSGRKSFLEKMKGRKLSPEHRAKCSLGMKGKKHSEETKKRMSDAQKNIAPEIRQIMNEGNKSRVTPEMREKCRITSTGRKMSDDARARLSKSKTGSKLSPETIAKRQATRKKNDYLKKLKANKWKQLSIF
jgi:group I intron endonuclease